MIAKRPCKLVEQEENHEKARAGIGLQTKGKSRMNQSPITILGIPLPSDSPWFLALVATHVMAGLGCVVTGMIAMFSPKAPGRHPFFGALYFYCLVAVFISMAILSALRWREDYRLFALGTLSLVSATVARGAVPREGRGSACIHLSGMGLSYILLLTAFYVDNGRNLPLWRDLPTWTYWLLPAVIGVPIITRALRRHPLAQAERRNIFAKPFGQARVLTVMEARAFYDRFGRKQDTQGFYEDPALNDLVARANLSEARNVFEFGCGTGKLAARILAERLPSTSSYLGCDLSPVMVRLSEKRLGIHGPRAKAILTDGAVHFPLSDHSADCVLSTYVLELLSDQDIRHFFDEAFRVLRPGGKLCLASLTEGTTIPSRFVSRLWRLAFHIRPSWVGGCRPIRLEPYLAPARWEVAYRKVLAPFGVPSEVLVLNPVKPLSQMEGTGSNA
ncbi:MAG TPA: class I SAM-dependent methyltransferase [Verrucomicrobiae bacterium]|nr:class I SAM-dependent methyltransferase [Verrucomicrobiae bacterium]